jgi:predicted AlkP superfamily phosphohydrolase/phosphomutase
MPRTLVVGFDGATMEHCDRWMADGAMPALSAIAADGAFGPLRSTVPYNSAVAWTTLATGTSPGRHGVFDFVLPRKDDYGYRVATREDRAVPALWNFAAEAGARVAVVNIPMTFPAEAVNGVVVSGMDAPRLDERAIHPVTLLDEARRANYRITSKAAHAFEARDFERAERELIDVLETRAAFVANLARPRDADLVMVNLEATDGAQHFFWHHQDPSHPRHDPAQAARFGDTIRRVYETTDRCLSRLIEAYEPDTVFVVSDHGGTGTNDWILFMNDWLEAEGFLSVARRAVTSLGQRLYQQAKKRLSVPARQALQPVLGRVLERVKGAALYGDYEWGRSRAYAHMQPAVRLNLAGREPSGTVVSGDVDDTLAEIAHRAQELRLPDGHPVFASVHRAQEIYLGDAPGGPDLVMETAPGLHVRSRNNTSAPGFLRRLDEVGMYLPSGVHSRVGVVAAAGVGISRSGRAEGSDIEQVAASVLAVMGLRAPGLDGQPFSFVATSPTAIAATPTMAAPAPTDLSESEEAEVMDRLRGLGYVD